MLLGRRRARSEVPRYQLKLTVKILQLWNSTVFSTVYLESDQNYSSKLVQRELYLMVSLNKISQSYQILHHSRSVLNCKLSVPLKNSKTMLKQQEDEFFPIGALLCLLSNILLVSKILSASRSWVHSVIRFATARKIAAIWSYISDSFSYCW